MRTAQVRKMLRDFFTENLSYKFVSLFIACVLWMTILGRRDFVFTKTVDLEFRASPGFSVVARPSQIKIRVSGNRSAIRHFMETTAGQNLIVDLNNRPPGLVELETPLNQFDVPMGVKILSVRPSVIRAEIIAPTEKETK